MQVCLKCSYKVNCDYLEFKLPDWSILFQIFWSGISKIQLEYKNLYKILSYQSCSTLCIITLQEKLQILLFTKITNFLVTKKNYKCCRLQKNSSLQREASSSSLHLHLQVSHPIFVCIQASLAVHETRKGKLARFKWNNMRKRIIHH